MVIDRIFLVLLSSVLVIACKIEAPNSQTNGVFWLDDILHASKDLVVCWENTTPETLNCTEELQSKLLEEFDLKTSLNLTFKSTCENLDANIKIHW